jgi:hypothetical protein
LARAFSPLAAWATQSRAVRVIVAVGLLAVVAGFVLDMSGRAPRTAGSDHTAIPVFAAKVPAGGVVCQPYAYLPADAARVQLLIGTYGHPVPALQLAFLNGAGTQVASAGVAAGAQEGPLTIPVHVARRLEGETSLCLHVGHGTKVAVAGEVDPVRATREQVNGKGRPGRIGLVYLRRGEETWWQLLPTIASRFGLGKASFFGDWTLAAVALLLLAVFGASVRLILRELT